MQRDVNEMRTQVHIAGFAGRSSAYGLAVWFPPTGSVSPPSAHQSLNDRRRDLFEEAGETLDLGWRVRPVLPQTAVADLQRVRAVDDDDFGALAGREPGAGQDGRADAKLRPLLQHPIAHRLPRVLVELQPFAPEGRARRLRQPAGVRHHDESLVRDVLQGDGF